MFSAGNNECGQRGCGQGNNNNIMPVKFGNNVILDQDQNSVISDVGQVISEVIKISCGYQHCILLTSKGLLFGTGCSYQHQLGLFLIIHV